MCLAGVGPDSVYRPGFSPFLGLWRVFVLHSRTPGHPPAPPPRIVTCRGPNPLPGASDLTVPALTLAGAYVTVLLHNSPDALPDALPSRKGVYRPQHVVAEVRKEQPGIIDAILAQFLLLGKTVKNEVDKRRDLRGGGPLSEVPRSPIKRREGDGDYNPNWDAMASQGVEDGPLRRAREGKSSERAGREVRVWKTSGIGCSTGGAEDLVS